MSAANLPFLLLGGVILFIGGALFGFWADWQTFRTLPVDAFPAVQLWGASSMGGVIISVIGFLMMLTNFSLRWAK